MTLGILLIEHTLQPKINSFIVFYTQKGCYKMCLCHSTFLINWPIFIKLLTLHVIGGTWVRAYMIAVWTSVVMVVVFKKIKNPHLDTSI
jgi:hypothetical protein